MPVGAAFLQSRPGITSSRLGMPEAPGRGVPQTLYNKGASFSIHYWWASMSPGINTSRQPPARPADFGERTGCKIIQCCANICVPLYLMFVCFFEPITAVPV